MKKNILIAVLGLAVAVSAPAAVPKVGTRFTDSKTGIEYEVINVPVVIDGVTNLVPQVTSVERKMRRRPLEPEATKRLHDGPVTVTSFFEASGRADWAEKGGEIRGSYLYTITVKAKSEVTKTNVNEATGAIHVEEIRTFLESRPTLSLSDIDAALALDTLPVDQAHELALRAGGIATTIAAKIGRLETAATIGVGMAAVEGWYRAAKNIDGASVRGILGIFGVEVPKPIDVYVGERIKKIMEEKVEWLHAQIDSIEGKSFIIAYDQEASGKPVDVTYRNVDGSRISDAEWEILRQANLFLDQNVVPNTNYEVGDSWTVWADEVQDLFGIAGDGRAEGQIRVKRTADQSNEDWTLGLAEADIAFRSDDGTLGGRMKFKNGNGIVDHESVSVRSLHATATGDLRSMSKTRHALLFDFVKRFRGNANLRFTLTTEPVSKNQ